jgi:hypothetical protein
MWHKQRRFVVNNVTRDELFDKFTGDVSTWCLCQGWRCEGLLWLNDSLSENGAQEYAVVRESDMSQVESVTVSWMSQKRLRDFINEFPAQDDHLNLGPVTNQLDTPGEHRAIRCPLCA